MAEEGLSLQEAIQNPIDRLINGPVGSDLSETPKDDEVLSENLLSDSDVQNTTPQEESVDLGNAIQALSVTLLDEQETDQQSPPEEPKEVEEEDDCQPSLQDQFQNLSNNVFEEQEDIKVEDKDQKSFTETPNEEEKEVFMVTQLESPRPMPDVPTLEEPNLFALYNEEELNAALQRFFKSGAIPDPEMRLSVIAYAKQKGVHAIMEEDYDLAAKCDDAIESITRAIETDGTNGNTSETNRYLKDRLEGAIAQHKIIEDKWRNHIEELQNNKKLKLDKLNERQQQERDELEERWSKPEATNPFAKPSSRLLQMRQMQKSLALSHKFDQAKQMKLMCEKIEKEESAVAQAKATEALRLEYENLTKKHERELECFEENFKRHLTEAERERDDELMANENLQRQLSNRIAAPKIQKRPKVLVPRVSSRAASQTVIYTQRTREKFSTYRNQTDHTKLDLQTIDPKVMAKCRPATATARKAPKS